MSCSLHKVLAEGKWNTLSTQPLRAHSGMLAGIWMAAKGVDHISRKVEHPLHVIW